MSYGNDKLKEFNDKVNNMSEEEDVQSAKYLHIFSQPWWHTDAYIVGDRHALEQLKMQIGYLLDEDDSKQHSANYYCKDGEGYSLIVILEDNMNSVPVPYTDDVAGATNEKYNAYFNTKILT